MYGVTYEGYRRAIARRRITQQEAEPEGMEPDQIQGGSNKLRWGIILGVIVIVVGVSLGIVLQPVSATGLAISLNSGKVTSANSAALELAIVLTIHNTTDKNLTYYGSSWSLSDNGASVDSGIFTDRAVLAPGATRVLNETITISLGDVITTTPITSAGSWRFRGESTVLTSPGTNSTQGFDFNFMTQ